VIDTHAHLDALEDPAAALARARDAGVTRVITIGTGIESCRAALALAAASEGVHAALGIDPHQAGTAEADRVDELRALLDHPGVVAVGETGLDYHYNRSPPEAQKRALAAHREIARDLGKPLVLHIRDAHADVLAVLDDAPPLPRRGVVHCFTGTPAEAEQWLARGYLLSFSGIATFPQADGLREAARLCPADRLLLETDAPYLAPVPVRGRKNEPANVAFTCAHLAGVRGDDPAVLAVQAGANARAFFRLPAPASA
jgi:TatD DNase family protein